MREIKAKEKTIGAYKYRVTPMGVGKGKALLVRLIRLMGPSIAEAVRAVAADGGSVSKMSIGVLAPSIGDVCERLNDDDLAFAVGTLAEETELSEGGGFAKLAPLVEYHFRGAYDELFQWLAFALEVNYGSFLAVARNLGAVPGDPTTSPSKSPST